MWSDPNCKLSSDETKAKRIMGLKKQHADPLSIFNDPEYRKICGERQKILMADSSSIFQTKEYRERLSHGVKLA